MSSETNKAVEKAEETYNKLEFYCDYHGIFSLNQNTVEDLIEVGEDEYDI